MSARRNFESFIDSPSAARPLAPGFLHVGRASTLLDLGIQLLDDRPRRSGGRHHAEPDRRFVALHAARRRSEHPASPASLLPVVPSVHLPARALAFIVGIASNIICTCPPRIAASLGRRLCAARGRRRRRPSPKAHPPCDTGAGARRRVDAGLCLGEGDEPPGSAPHDLMDHHDQNGEVEAGDRREILHQIERLLRHQRS